MKKKLRNKLSVKRETLRNLASQQLGNIVGGTSETCPLKCGETTLCSVIVCCSLTGGSAACSIFGLTCPDGAGRKR